MYHSYIFYYVQFSTYEPLEHYFGQEGNHRPVLHRVEVRSGRKGTKTYGLKRKSLREGCYIRLSIFLLTHINYSTITLTRGLDRDSCYYRF